MGFLKGLSEYMDRQNEYFRQLKSLIGQENNLVRVYTTSFGVLVGRPTMSGYDDVCDDGMPHEYIILTTLEGKSYSLFVSSIDSWEFQADYEERECANL